MSVIHDWTAEKAAAFGQDTLAFEHDQIGRAHV